MTLLERYLNYLSQICEGSRKAPDGITLTKTCLLYTSDAADE